MNQPLARATSILMLLASGSAAGHGRAASPAHLWSAWNLDPADVIPILLAAWIYAHGLRRLWRHAGTGRVISRRRACAYSAGIAALVGALLSPLDTAADTLFSVHMIQHLTLIFVAAPLLIVGAPDVAFLWALPARWRQGGGRAGVRLGRSLGGGLRTGRAPLIVVLVATGVLWLWHLPVFYDLAMRDGAVHWAEHASFLVTSLLFWATVLRLRPREHMGNGVRILYAFGMALQGSILGALITFASRPLYESHLHIPAAWGMAPLADQQLAGLIMWVPPVLLYIGVIAWLFTAWLKAISASREG